MSASGLWVNFFFIPDQKKIYEKNRKEGRKEGGKEGEREGRKEGGNII